MKEQINCKMKWRNSCTTMSLHCSPCGKCGIGTTPKVDGMTLSCVSRPDVGDVERTRHRKMYTRVPRETCLRETAKAPIKTGWVETDK